MTFPIHTEQTAAEESRETLASIRERYGFIPNLAGAFAESPGAFKGLLSALQSYDDESLTLSPLERQVVQLAVAVENRCDYCAAAHSMLANSLGLDRSEIDRLHAQEALSDSKLESLRSFASQVVATRGWVSDADTRAFLDAGFTRGQVYEVLLGVAIKTLTNYANHVAKPEVNQQFREFLPKWSKAA